MIVTHRSVIPWGGSGIVYREREGRCVVAVANGSTCGFDIDHKLIADPWLQNVVNWLHPGERTREFLAELRCSSDWDEGFPCLDALVAEAKGGKIAIHWVGGSAAQLVREGAVIAETTPHFFYRDERTPVALRVMTNRQATAEEATFESVEWTLQEGDVVVIVDHVAIVRCQWWPLPRAWPLPLDAEVLANHGRWAYAAAEHAGAATVQWGKPPFAGVFATLTYSSGRR
jgi:hypothetical protein